VNCQINYSVGVWIAIATGTAILALLAVSRARLQIGVARIVCAFLALTGLVLMEHFSEHAAHFGYGFLGTVVTIYYLRAYAIGLLLDTSVAVVRFLRRSRDLRYALTFNAFAIAGAAASAAVILYGYASTGPAAIYLRVPDGFVGEIAFVTSVNPQPRESFEDGFYVYRFGVTPGKELRLADLDELRCPLKQGSLYAKYANGAQTRVREIPGPRSNVSQVVFHLDPFDPERPPNSELQRTRTR